MAAGREDNCVTINHTTRHMSNPGGKIAELYAMLKDQGVDIPPTVLFLEFTRNGPSQKTLTYRMWLNPEQGIPSWRTVAVGLPAAEPTKPQPVLD
jgi:hypothetical protein